MTHPPLPRLLALGAWGAALLVSTVALADGPWADLAQGDDLSDALVRDGDKVQIIVDVQDDLSDEEVQALGQTLGVELRLNSALSDDANLYVAWVHEDEVERVLERIAKTDGVEFTEPNMQMEALGSPNDPLYQHQWHFDQIKVEGAWTRGAGKGVTVAVIDTGVAWRDNAQKNFVMVPDLKGTQFVEGYDFVDDDKDPFDEHGHGTHVAGTIAQTTHNGYGVAGIAYESRIMPLRVLNRNGSGSVADISDAIRFAADNDAKVINMSLGGPLPSLTMRSAIQYAHDKGVVIVAAAGNSGRKMRSWPAAYDHVISVSATQFDGKTTFYSQWGSFVDIAAPGGNTQVDQNRDGRPDGVMQQTLQRGSTSEHDFSLYMGTSMACPHVAGTAALLVSHGVTNPDAVEKLLKETANDDKREEVRDFEDRYGAGILDADKATQRATSCLGLTRLGVGGLLGFLLLGLVRRRDAFGRSALTGGGLGLFSVGAVLASSGLFFVSWAAGLLGLDLGAAQVAVEAVSRPLAMLDLTVMGPGAHQNPLLASALIPLGALALGLGNRKAASLAAGLAVGFAGFLLVDAWMLTSDVVWLPGTGLLDRGWLLANGLISAGLGYLALKRD